MAISAKELARILGISPATVSMVMNNKPGISQETRDLVMKAAQENGYISKKNAATAVSSSVIQMIIFKKHGRIASNTPFFAELMEGITSECHKKNCALHISYVNSRYDIAEQVNQIKEVECAGIILLGTEMMEEDFDAFKSIDVPIVVLDAYYDSLNFDCITINNVQGAYQATSYLVKRGFKKIGYLHSSIPISNFDERKDGFYKALKNGGYDITHPYVLRISPTSQEGYMDMLSLLGSQPELADAYFADNDIIAAAAMKAFRDYGCRMPEDISVIGFDNMPLCDMMVPALTTMNVKKREMGSTAVKRLLDRIDDPKREVLKMSLATTLIERESVR